MTTLYQQVTATSWLRTSDDVLIYADPLTDNYQGLLAWISEGNTPDPLPVAMRPTVIPIALFWARFTAAEQAAIQSAAATAPSIAQAMTFASVIGMVNLVSGPIVTNWMATLVAAGIITSARATIILTP
jgi:hypothetical protein